MYTQQHTLPYKQGGPHVRISLDAVLAAGAEEYKLPPYKYAVIASNVLCVMCVMRVCYGFVGVGLRAYLYILMYT